MQPPECYNELSRKKVVDQYLNAKQWDLKPLFKKIIGQIRDQFSVHGVSISMISSNKVIFKHECLLDMNEVIRIASIDSHAILSKDYFLLLDASQDWRTNNNPFVNNLPYIKFYCGVPLKINNEIIGILAIFDSSNKLDFTQKQINQLIDHSKSITDILNTPTSKLQQSLTTKPKFNDNNELDELRLKLGRATSRGTLMTVFEKDGSGGPYLQDNNFKHLSRLSVMDNMVNNNRLIWERLSKIDNTKKAGNIICKTLAINYKIKFVYILEIRTAEPFTISNHYWPSHENKIEIENFGFMDKLVENGNQENDSMTRIIGSYGANHPSLKFENAIHFNSFKSDYGIKYRDPHNKAVYNKGILMPFYKHNSKLVKKSESSKSNKLEIYLRSGGYLIGCFNDNSNPIEFDNDLISKIYSNISIFRKIYI